MSDDYTILNPGVGGDVMDETAVYYPNPPLVRKRPRVVITGEGNDDIVPALNSNPVGDEFGLATRPIITGYPGSSLVQFNIVTLVPTSVETTVATYTVPTGKTLYFLGYSGSGNTNALFKLYVNGVPYFSSRSSIANLNVEKNFSTPPFTVSQSVTISLKVTHSTNVSCNFEGTILGYLI